MKVKKKDINIDRDVTYAGAPTNLMTGDVFTVYGIEVIENEKYYLIQLDGDYTVRLYHSDNFEIIDSTPSKHWIEDEDCKGRFLFEDWIGNGDYLEWFFNGGQYLGLEDWEFPDGLEYFPHYEDLINEEKKD